MTARKSIDESRQAATRRINEAFGGVLACPYCWPKRGQSVVVRRNKTTVRLRHACGREFIVRRDELHGYLRHLADISRPNMTDRSSPE